MADDESKPLLPFDVRDRQVQLNLALAALVAGLIGYLYFGIGSLYQFYAGYLSLPNGSYSHAPMIPCISAVLVWWKREELFAAPRRQTTSGLWIIGMALLMFYIGHKGELWRLMLLSLILLLWAIPFYLWGWGVARHLVFPAGFLLFGVPLNFITDLTNPLKRFVSGVSAVVLNIAGVAVERDGARLYSVPHGRFQLEVADACSGINSLIALVTLATVFAYVFRERQWQRWVLVVAAVPLAMLGNLIRVTLSGVVGNVFGQSAISTFDNFSTFVVFVPAIAALLAVNALLDVDWTQARERWFGAEKAESPKARP